MKPTSLKRVGVELVVVSFVVLFQELALIRWLPAQVRVVAYFQNLILISAFLGLGVGALRARKGSLLWLWPLGLTVLIGTAMALSRVAFTANGVTEHLWLLYSDLSAGAPVVEGIRLPIVVLFVLAGLTFVPLGQLVAQRLNVFRERSSPLWGYSFDLVGSLLGVVVFSFLSFTGTFPVVWFGVVFAVGGVLLLGHRRLLLAHALVGVGVLAGVHHFEKADRYSPYYALSSEPVPGTPDYVIRTNGSLHQVAVGLEASDPVLTEDQARAREGYPLPFQLLGKPLGKVLVLGAGTGNDVAVLLDQGAQEVHAVEIDPVILQMGRELHPDKPYDDPRVTVLNTDARSYLQDTEERYDLVVFGTLDSMTRLSALSNVRLDNFVYTLEAIEAAARILKPNGGLVLYFWVGKEHIFSHLTTLLFAAFGELPEVYQGEWGLFSHVFLAGPAFSEVPDHPARVDLRSVASWLDETEIPTDDWPYLYLPRRGVNTFYLSLMFVFLAISFLAVSVASREMREGMRTGRGIDGEMFFFGVAFLLLETRFVTAINLVWGATWITSAAVFGSILATILLTTILMELRPIPWKVASTGLVLSVLLTFFVPVHALLAESSILRLALSVSYVGTPIFFAAACFAERFRVRESVDVAFGWNLLGAVAGGLIEFFSMLVGIHAMALVALLAYAVAFFLGRSEGLSADLALDEDQPLIPRHGDPAEVLPRGVLSQRP
jgi:SAM-dependent methyltransferase